MLDENRITNSGAKKLFSKLTKATAMRVEMMNNPIDDAKLVLQHARDCCPRAVLKVGPVWDEGSAVEALTTRASWHKYYFGPSQLLRATIMASSN